MNGEGLPERMLHGDVPLPETAEQSVAQGLAPKEHPGQVYLDAFARREVERKADAAERDERKAAEEKAAAKAKAAAKKAEKAGR